MLRRTFLCGMAAVAALSGASAQEKHDTKALTYLQVINVGNALRQLGDYRDPQTGKTVSVPFRFAGGALLDIAVDIDLADQAQKTVEGVRTTLVKQHAGDDAQKLADADAEIAREKDQAKQDRLREASAPLRARVARAQQQVGEELQKALDRPAGVALRTVKRADLCIDADKDGNPVKPCAAVNAIPPAILAALVPIIIEQ